MAPAAGIVRNLLSAFRANIAPGGMVDGKEVKMEVKVGDKVIYSKYSGTDVKLDDVEYIVAKQSDIVAVIED